MLRSRKTSTLFVRLASVSLVIALAAPLAADQIPTTPDLETETVSVAPAPTAASPAAGPASSDGAEALRGQLQALGLSRAEIDDRLAQLSATDVNALATSLDQNQVAGIPGFIFPATIIALVVLGVVLLLLETSTQKKLQ